MQKQCTETKACNQVRHAVFHTIVTIVWKTARPRLYLRIFTNFYDFEKLHKIREFLRILKPVVTNSQSMSVLHA